MIQVFLPLLNSNKEPLPHKIYIKIREELTDKFGGITAYSRLPAVGLWKENPDKTVKDDIVIYEVMAADLDSDWWKKYKQSLEITF
ncbi:MAG: hypothetical protein JWQ25_2528, partial [Daejeonella sp.]|nr:hypothetical protein [Daejeonella sp.]